MNIIEEVKKLNLPLGKYVVFGSGILSVKRIRPSKDVDLIGDRDIFKDLQSRGWKRKFLFRRVLTCKLITNGTIEVFSHAYIRSYRKTLDHLVRTAEIIDGIPFMNINELREFKIQLGRAKDLRDVQLIDEYLRKQTK